MSLAKVLRLEDYRGKRSQRLRLSDRLYSADPQRLAIFRYLTEISHLCEAERVATVWVDEYGQGAVHPHVVLDHLMDRPRRYFSTEPLRRAWELGVPGAIDALSEVGSSVPATFAISLGSDGMRAWFLLAESAAGRPLLQPAVRDRLMFLAGECAAVLLHRELDQVMPDEEEGEGAAFPAWPILKDLEGRETDEEAGRRIAQRFVVGRVARVLIDEDLVMAPERVQEQVRRARTELPRTWDSDDPEQREVGMWHRVLDALERGELNELAERLLELGDVVQQQGHLNGALELYTCAREVATAIRAPRVVAEAARYSGSLMRRRGDRTEAEATFERAREIAEVAGLRDVVARSMVGLALVHQDAGNMPRARSSLEESLAIAEESGDRDSVGMTHHALMSLEQLCGNHTQSLRHGWLAVAKYECPDRRTRGMAALAAALLDYGDHEAAEDAWSLVADTAKDRYYLTYAHDALSHLAALEGDRARFERHSSLCDALGWEANAGYAKAEILYYRGLSYRALGELDEAREWLERAVAFAEDQSYNQVVFNAEEALGSLETDPQQRSTSEVEGPAAPAAPPELRDGLRTMRRELALAGS
ncbi:MAG: tetratricopeptide repeat protein [Gemmatimonadota bacterium]|jgi:tetratricopeptide (TPR) repeat protein